MPWEVEEEEEAGGGGGGGAAAGGGGGERLDWMKGEAVGVEDTGMEARGGLGGRAGRTVEGTDWIEELMRFSISSMSDCEEEWSGMVSLCDIFSLSPLVLVLVLLMRVLDLMSSEREREEGNGCFERARGEIGRAHV